MGKGALLGILSGLGDILGSVFRGLFEFLINSLVVPVVEATIRIVVTVIQYFTSTIFYEISKFLLGLVDFVEILFRALAGLPSTTSNGSEIIFSINGKSGDLLIQMLTSQEVLQVFYATAIVGVFLLIITTIFQMIKVEYTTEGAQNSKSGIIGKSLKSMCNMLIIPLLCIMGVFIGNQVLDLIDTATGGGSGSKISGTLWVTAASGAMLANPGDFTKSLKELGTIKDENSIDNDGGLLGVGVSLAITRGFYPILHGGEDAPALVGLGDLNGDRTSIENDFMSGTKNYAEMKDVITYYNPFEVNYLVLIFGACIIIKCLYHTCFGLVDRLYQCTALFIVMPMVVGMTPVKDSLGSWRSKFISKALSAYGTVISLNLFFIIVRILLNIDITFGSAYDNWIFPKSFMAGLIKAILVIVGCLMIEKLSGDLAGYFGGGNAMAEGKGLAKDAVSGLAKVGMATGMVAFGGASLLAKGVKGAGGIANKLTGGGAGRLASKVTGGISKGVHAATGVVGKGVGAIVHAPQNIGKKLNSGPKLDEDGQKYYNLLKTNKAAQKNYDLEKDVLEGMSGLDPNSDEYKEQVAKTEAAKKAAEKANGAARRFFDDNGGENNSSLTKAAAKFDNKHVQASKAYYEDQEKKRKERSDLRRDKFTTGKEAVRQLAQNKFGAGAAFKTFAPKAIQNFEKDYQDAWKQGNSASPEGETMMANIQNAKKKEAEEAYNTRNKRVVELKNLEQLGLVFETVNKKLSSSADDASKQLEKLAKVLANLKERYNDKNTDDNERDAIMQQAYGIQQNMQQLNGNLKFDGAFDYTGELKVDFKMDPTFMKRMEEQIKKGVKMDNVMEQVREEFKKMGLEGNDKLLNEIYKALEELKNQVGGK